MSEQTAPHALAPARPSPAPPWHPFIALVVIIGLGLHAGCADPAESPESPRATPAPATPVAHTQVTPPLPKPPSIDRFGNLQQGSASYAGFALPATAVLTSEHGHTPVYYVPATEERVVRFFRSRGHLLAELPSGWRFEHTEQSLGARKDITEGMRLTKAWISRGPGPGWSIRFDDGSTRSPQKPALLTLIERDPAPAKDNAIPNEATHTDAVRNKALKRRVDTRRKRDLSKKIYQWSKDNKGRDFKD